MIESGMVAEWRRTSNSMEFSHQILSPTLVIICAVMVIAAAAVYWAAKLGSPWTVPRAALRAIVQLAAVAAVLAAVLTHLWSSLLALAVMFDAATVTAATAAN